MLQIAEAHACPTHVGVSERNRNRDVLQGSCDAVWPKKAHHREEGMKEEKWHSWFLRHW